MSAAPLFLFILLFLAPLARCIQESETEALINFKKSLINVHGLESWKPDTSPCDKHNWEGVYCYEELLDGIHLEDMDLSGQIDIDSLMHLPTLRTLSFRNNSFTGPIPAFNRLTYLKSLLLSFNKFSGEIPSDFFSNMEMLKKVWLSANKFTGKIPDSLGKLTRLMELHLEQNAFTGPVPDISRDTIISFDLSNNQLEGTIPPAMSRYGPKSFQDNPLLCGKPLSNECPVSKPKPDHGQSWTIMTWVVLSVIIFMILLFIYLRTKKKGSKFSRLRKDSMDNVAEVRLPSIRRNVDPDKQNKSESPPQTISSSGSGQKASGTIQRGLSRGKTNDLVMVNDHKGIFGLADLMKAAAEVMGSGGLGSAYKAVMANGVAVVVKRMREMNKMSRDTFDAEIRRLGKLSNQNVLTPLAYHYRKEEKLLVSELVQRGSLLSILHGDRGVAHAKLTWPIRLKIIKGVARGLDYLHTEFPSYELPHGNLKSSNILLDTNHEPFLSDYAFHPLINTTQAVNSLSAYKSPEAILYQQLSPKSDVFCLGVVILEIITGKYPSQYQGNQKGGTDIVQWVRSAVSENKEVEFIDPDISGKWSDSVEEMSKLLGVGADCTESNLDERIDMREALRRIEEIQQ